MLLSLLLCAPAHAQRSKRSGTGQRNEIQLPGGSSTALRKRAVEALFYDAVALKGQGKREQAIALFKEVAAADTGAAAAYYSLGELYLEGNQASLALPMAERAYRLDPKNPWYASLLALTYENMRQPDRAVSVLEKAVQQAPNDLELNLRLAEAYLQVKRYDDALAVYDRIEQRTGLTDQLGVLKFRLFMGTRQFYRGIGEMKKYLALQPEEPRYYFFLYELQSNAEEYDSAMVTLEALRSIDPNNDQASFILADFYTRRQQPERARQILDEALSNPLISLAAKLQFMDQQLRRYADPLERRRIRGYMGQISAAHPDAQGVLLYQARLQLLDQKPDSARVLYRRALDRDDSSLQGWSELLDLELQGQNWTALRQGSDEALAVFPGNIQFLFSQGVACYQLKDYAAAVKSLESALATDPSNPAQRVQLLTLLGDSHHFLGQHEQSDKRYEAALQLDPSNATVLNNYAYFLSVRKVNLPKAKEMIARVMRDPENAENASFQDTYGWILFQLGDYREAITWIERAYRQEPSPEVIEHLGDASAMNGQADRAVNLWQEALSKLTGDDPVSTESKARLQRKIAARKL